MSERLQPVGFSFEHPAQLTPSDVDKLMIIEREAFPIDYYNREQLLEEYKANPLQFIVARDRKAIPVGYISGELRVAKGSIVSLAVGKEVRGKGVGGYLNRLMIDYLVNSGAQQLVAHTREDNIVSIRLFERFGFVFAGKVEDYYRDGSPALVLRRWYHF